MSGTPWADMWECSPGHTLETSRLLTKARKRPYRVNLLVSQRLRIAAMRLPNDCYVLETRSTNGAKMAKKKKIVRRAWTPSEVRELKSLARQKTGVAKISKALKRSIGATAVKAHQLGVSLDTRG
jgi:hypothetical protein